MLLGFRFTLPGSEDQSMRARRPLPLLFLMAAFPAHAAPATSDGAKAIEQDYVAYFGKAVVDKGILTVTPNGEGYVVSWDLQKALDLVPTKASLQIDPLVYTLTPHDDGAWTTKADHLPSLVFGLTTDKNRLNGALDLTGFHLEAVSDSAQKDFLRSNGAADAVSAKFRILDPTQHVEAEFVESGVSTQIRARTSESGVDVAVAHSAARVTETVASTPTDPQGPPIKVAYEVGGIADELAVSGLRAREIADLWKYVVVHLQDDGAPPDLTQRVRAALPLWNDFHAHAEMHDLALQTDALEARLKTLGETLALTGLADEAGAAFGLSIEDLAFKSALLPSWAAQLSPVSLNLNLRAADHGLDKVAELVLDDPNFGSKGELTPETQDKIGEAVLAGEPKLVLAPGRLTAPIIDLAFEGEAGIESGAPTGHFTVSADGLDKTMALLQEVAKSEPDAQSVVLGVAFVKGLATTGPDGRLMWKVDVSSAGEVSVNGTALPMGK